MLTTDPSPADTGPTDGNHLIRIGDWLLDPSSRLLSRGEVEHRIEPKMVDVLLLLVRRSGQVVERREIELSVWSAAAVGSDLLNRTIWKLRQVLDDDAADPRYIETIPRVGYRLVSPVEGGVGAAGHGGVPRGLSARRSAALAAVVVAAFLVWWRFGTARADGGPDQEVLISRPLTSDPGYEANPSVSPDGRYVVFQRYDPDAALASWDVALVEVESGRRFALASAPGVQEYAPTWAPAGDSVAFIRSAERCQIIVQALDGPGAEVAECEADESHEVAWLRDGTLVLASVAPGRTLGLERIRRTGGRERVTSPPAGFDGDRMPRLSPDGRTLAFVRQRTEGVSDIYTLDLNLDTDPGQPRAVTADHRRISGLDWDPSGTALLFSSRRGGANQVWRVPVEGGPPSPVSLPGRNAGPMSASGGILVYEEYRGDSDLWIYDPDAGEVKPWYGSSRSEWGATVSPDGHTVAFVSDQTGSDQIWVVPAGGKEARQLTTFDGAELDPPQWHSDSRRLVFASTAYGSFDIFTVNVETGALERLTHGDDDERTPAWWKGSVVYAASRTGTRELWLLDPDDGRDERITSGGGSLPRPGPSGADLLFARPDESGVWRLPSLNGEVQRVWRGPGGDESTNWCPSDEGIIHLRSAEGTRSELVLLNPSSGAESVLARIPHEISRRSGVSRFPDGRVLFGVITRSESDLWIAR